MRFRSFQSEDSEPVWLQPWQCPHEIPQHPPCCISFTPLLSISSYFFTACSCRDLQAACSHTPLPQTPQLSISHVLRSDSTQQQKSVGQPSMMHQQPHHLPLLIHSAPPPPPSSSEPAAVEMDPRVWRRLPPPLVDRVLACLPTPSFLRLRAACRRFYGLLYSSPFLHSHLLLSPHLPFFAFAFPSAGHLLLLDPTSPQAPSWSRLPLPLPAPGAAFSPAAASAGLLAFLSDASGHKTLLLVNPITRLLAPLPICPSARLSPTVGLAAGPTSFIAVVAGDDLVSPFAVKNISANTFVADAASVPPSGFWAPSSLLPRLSSLDPRAGMAFASGRFYCMSSAPFAVLVFDVAANFWSKVHPPMRRFLRSPALVELGGGREREARVALVAAVEKSRLSVPRSVRLWTLRAGHGGAAGGSGGGAWTEVARMPPDVHAQFAAAEAGCGFECAAHGDFVVLAPRGPASPVLVFDSRRDEWRWAPPCPYPYVVGGIGGGGGGGVGFRVFAYEPRLATPAIGLLDATAQAALHGMQG